MPHKTTSKVTVKYLLIFRQLGDSWEYKILNLILPSILQFNAYLNLSSLTFQFVN